MILRKRLWVPEVVQASAMDCGPATVAALVSGFGVPVSFERLREACQTHVDGTSIDVLEEVVKSYGIDAVQTLLPVDHLALPEAQSLPAIAVIRGPMRVNHFVVVWSRVGNRLQIMDPNVGRRWVRAREFARQLYVHTERLSRQTWLRWAQDEDFGAPLCARLVGLGLSRRAAQAMLRWSRNNGDVRSLSTLDAATRMVGALVDGGGLRKGPAAFLLRRLWADAMQAGDPREVIPEDFWTVLEDDDDPGVVVVRGAVVVAAAVDSTRTRSRNGASERGSGEPRTPAAVSMPPPSRPVLAVTRALRGDSGLVLMLALAVVLTAGGVVGEALLFRSLFELGDALALPEQRLTALSALTLFLVVVTVVEMQLALAAWQLGRRLEVRLRIGFLDKIPGVPDRFFSSRPASDMAQRGHEAQRLRRLPQLLARVVVAVLKLGLTAAAACWLFPGARGIVIATAVVCVSIPLLTQRLLSEPDLKLRTLTGALSRHYLEALLGLVPARAHGSERVLRREHEMLLVQWAKTGRTLLRLGLASEGIQMLLAFTGVAWVLAQAGISGGLGPGGLLLAYWMLGIPTLGVELSALMRQLPSHRNTILRLLEPVASAQTLSDREPTREGSKVRVLRPSLVRAQRLSVKAAGITILDAIDLDIAPGEHVAIVGSSGSGKSTLLGLLLGLHAPASGRLEIDGEPVDAEAIARLRRDTAWIDPAVCLWNRSLLDNLRYGAPDGAAIAFDRVLFDADLVDVLERLPDGLQTRLGEGGGLVSGGEGQRVRLARAMARPTPRLVLMDEPFRGLDRDKRCELLTRARERWASSTMLCVTHDVESTMGFERVLVVEGGRIVEDGSPRELAARGSRYRDLLEAERQVLERHWGGCSWRVVTMRDGAVDDGGERALSNRTLVRADVVAARPPGRGPVLLEPGRRAGDVSR